MKIEPIHSPDPSKIPMAAARWMAGAPELNRGPVQRTRDLREMMLVVQAALDDDTARDHPECVSWLHWFAREYPEEWFRGISKMLPRQIAVSAVSTVLTAEDIAAMRERIEAARAGLLTPAEAPVEPMDISAEVAERP